MPNALGTELVAVLALAAAACAVAWLLHGWVGAAWALLGVSLGALALALWLAMAEA